MTRETAGAGFVRDFLEFAVVKGASRQLLVANSGIRPSDLADPEARISLRIFEALMRAAKKSSGEPALALLFGEVVSLEALSRLGLAAQGGSALDCLAEMNRYMKRLVDVTVTGSAGRFEIAVGPDGIWLTDRYSNAHAFPELAEIALAQFMGWARRDGLAEWIKAVHFKQPEPAHGDAYARVLKVPVTFGAPRNGIRIEPVLAAQQPPKSNTPRRPSAEERAAILKGLGETGTYRAKVESLILPLLHTGEAGVETVAARMGASRQTLFRRLRQEGHTFETVLDDLRHRMAIHYLCSRKASVSETAHLLGFSESAAFTRKFKRWTGVTPRVFRSSMAQ